ncbi:MAG TPA: TonB-dependent receptor [Vicinamibacterales bacterium]|nr:TonB-dependent receptor [Vicinamibacterales bacterium]
MVSRFALIGHVAPVVCLALIVALGAAPADAGQAARPGTLQVTVVDQSGAVISNATVTVEGAEAATKAQAPVPVQTNAQGVASVAGLPPGRYSVRAEFPGFETRALPEVRVRAGDNKQVMMLPIAGVQDSVTVERNKQESAADRQSTFGTVLTREQLEALSDDPDILRQQLQDMAGPGAVIKVDSFEGAALPPKAMIRSIRISRDQFAAENHSAGGTSVEIITQPGMGPIRYNTAFRYRGGRLSGRSPFTPERGPEQSRNYQINLNGTLVPQKASFNFNVDGLDSYETPNINAFTVGGIQRSEAVRLRTPRDNTRVNANVDYAVTLNQTLRFGYFGNRNTADNLGIGEYDFEERAYSTENSNHNVRIQHMGPLGRRMFTRTRLQVSVGDSEAQSALEARTVRVLEAFTRGGAQRAGGQHTRAVNAASDLDYVRGIHSYRTGLEFNFLRVRADDTTNYLGTYTFESPEAFEEGRPRSYTQRVGDPSIRYNNLQGGAYIQDDMRLRRNLTFSAGMRYEAQTHVDDYNGLMPRVGVTWAPFKSGATTLRSSWGIFHDWLQSGTYEQTLRVDGINQREVDLLNPAYPDAGDIGAGSPANRYLLDGDLRLPRTSRASVGVDQRLHRLVQTTTTYAYQRGSSVYRGLNLNAPVDGARPDEQFGNIIEVVSDARTRQHEVQFAMTVNPGALFPAFNAPLVKWDRITVFTNYTWLNVKNNSDGPFAIPATGSLDAEWGSAPVHVPHRFNVTFNNQIVRNLLGQINFNTASGNPYTIRTGFDENGDLIYNDRPDGVGRNTVRGEQQWNLNMAAAYTILFGRQTTLPPGIAVVGGGGGPQVQTVNQSGQRFRLQFVVQVQNVTNNANYSGYSGVRTSPFFGQPTNVLNTRKVDMGVQLSF